MTKQFLFFLILGVTTSYAQNKVKWSLDFDHQKQSIQLNGAIEQGWHLYSSLTPADAGPIPVQVKAKKTKGLKTKGGFVEKFEPLKIFDANFDSDVYIFEQNYLAEQKIKLKKNCEANITVTYMICNDERCLPPIDEVLSIKLNTNE